MDKTAEINAGIPPDDWLNSVKVYKAKWKHLKALTLFAPGNYKMLDAGCGTGTYGLILAENPEYEVVGVDISEIAVRKAKELANKNELPYYPMVGDLEELPFADGSFDVVLTGWVLHHFPKIETVCAELCRVLKKGGRIAIVEPNEGNLAVRLSRFVEGLFRRKVLEVGWDTPNRTRHIHKDYIREFGKSGIVNVCYSSCYAPLPPIPKGEGRKMDILFGLRSLLFSVGVAILPRPMNGSDLLIWGVKV